MYYMSHLNIHLNQSYLSTSIEEYAPSGLSKSTWNHML